MRRKLETGELKCSLVLGLTKGEKMIEEKDKKKIKELIEDVVNLEDKFRKHSAESVKDQEIERLIKQGAWELHLVKLELKSELVDILVEEFLDEQVGNLTNEQIDNYEKQIRSEVWEKNETKTNNERFENIYLGFWELVAKEFPNIKTGDYEPLQVLDFERQMKKHVKQWVIQNNTDGEYIDF